MSERLRSDFWVQAYLRRCGVEGLPAMLRRRGAAEAGAILIKLDRLDGSGVLFGPAPQSNVESRGSDRTFARLHAAEVLPDADLEQRIASQLRFDADLWIVEVENRAGEHFLDLAEE